LSESFEKGVAGEIENITVYGQFLEAEDLPEDVRSVFERLMAASENHLAAFERGVAGNPDGAGRNR
jgi:rubrerythrin